MLPRRRHVELPQIHGAVRPQPWYMVAGCKWLTVTDGQGELLAEAEVPSVAEPSADRRGIGKRVAEQPLINDRSMIALRADAPVSHVSVRGNKEVALLAAASSLSRDTVMQQFLRYQTAASAVASRDSLTKLCGNCATHGFETNAPFYM